MLLPQQPSPYPVTTTYCYPATMLLPQQPSPYPYNYILLPCNHAATPTTKSLPLQLHTATLQPCCYPNNQVPTLTTTYCYPATMLLPQQPSPYPYNYILLPCNHAATPTTKSLPLQLHTATLYNHAVTPTTKSLPLQLHTATLQPCCYPNNQVPTLTTTYCYATTMLLPQQPSPYPYNYIYCYPATMLLPHNLVPTLTTTYCYPIQPCCYPKNHAASPTSTMIGILYATATTMLPHLLHYYQCPLLCVLYYSNIMM